MLWVFGNHVSISAMAVERIQRWALYLNGFDFELQHIPGKENLTANFLPRMPVKGEEIPEKVLGFNVINLQTMETLPIFTVQLEKMTLKDKILATVYRYMNDGWPSRIIMLN